MLWLLHVRKITVGINVVLFPRSVKVTEGIGRGHDVDRPCVHKPCDPGIHMVPMFPCSSSHLYKEACQLRHGIRTNTFVPMQRPTEKNFGSVWRKQAFIGNTNNILDMNRPKDKNVRRYEVGV